MEQETLFSYHWVEYKAAVFTVNKVDVYGKGV